MSDGVDIPGMGWWPPKLRLKRSDLCSECVNIDFMAAFTPPPDYSYEEKPWTLLIQRERLVIDSNCHFCRYFSHICYSIDEDGGYFIVFHDPSSPLADAGDTQHGKKCPSLDKILISVLRVEHRFNVLQCFRKHTFLPFRDILRQNSGAIVCQLNKPARELRTPQIVPQVFDVSLAKVWLEICTRHHRACRCPVNTRLQTPRTRLIDCTARKLINTGTWPFHRPRYAALSYRWGLTSENKMEQDREGRDEPKDPLSNLPLTIEDAISVTKGLGLRYLWVDQYCIDQNNSKEKQAQIRKMDRIYQCAEVTIMAAAGDDCHYGLPGVSKRARQVLDPFICDALTFGLCPAGGPHWQHGAWHERGWTFQETYLSRRRLVFSDTLAHFECTTHEPWQKENSGGFETAQHNPEVARKLKSRHVDILTSINMTAESFDWCEIAPLTTMTSLQNVAVTANGRRGHFESCILEYYVIVSYYTMRKLSYASDGLNAFLGLANALQNLHLPIYNVAGVPFLVGNKRTDRDYWAETSLSSGLAWYSVQGTVRSDQQNAGDGRFPSWSWGNVKLWRIQHSVSNGRFETPCPPGKGPNRHFSKYNAQLRDIRIEFVSDGGNQVIGLVEYARKSRKAATMSLPQPTALLFKARFVPSHAISLHPEVENTDQHNITVVSSFRGDFCHDTHGMSRDFRLSLIEDDYNETNSGELYPEGDLLKYGPSWVFPRLRLLVHDRKFYDDMTTSGWSLLLLRCFRRPTNARLLVIKVLEGNTASRVGIINLWPEGWVEVFFLRCFTVEREVRLV